jgi:hypothetical protein
MTMTPSHSGHDSEDGSIMQITPAAVGINQPSPLKADSYHLQVQSLSDR